MAYTLASNAITSALVSLVALDSDNTTIKDFVSGVAMDTNGGSIQLATSDATWGATAALRWFRPAGSISYPTGHLPAYTDASGISVVLIQPYSAGNIGSVNGILTNATGSAVIMTAGALGLGLFDNTTGNHTTYQIGGFFAATLSGPAGTLHYYWAPNGTTSPVDDGTGTAISGAHSGTLGRLGVGGAAGDNFIYYLAVFSRVMTPTELATINADPKGTFFSLPLPVSGTAPGGTVGAAYTTTFTASGGTSPYTYSVGSGSLPAGLSLNTSSGVVSGTPTTTGTSTFVIHAVDNS